MRKNVDRGWKNWARVCTQGYVLALLVAFPLFVDSTKYQQLTRGKQNAFATLTLLYAALMLLRFLSDWIGQSVRPMRIGQIVARSSVTQKAFVLFMLIVCLSAAVSPYPETVWMGGARYNGLFTMLLYAVTFLMISCFGRMDRWCVAALALSTLLLSALGIAMVFGLDPLSLYPEGRDFGTLPFVSTLGNIDFCNAFLCIALPLLGMAFVVECSARRYWLLAPMVVAFYLILCMDVDAGKVAIAGWIVLFLPAFMRSRERLGRFGALLATLLVTLSAFLLIGGHGKDAGVWMLLTAGALLFAAGTVLPRRIRRPYPEKGMRIVAFCLLALLIICGAAAAISLANAGVDNFLADIGRMLQGTVHDYFGHGRIGIWRRSLELAMERPWLGFGPDAYAQAFSERFAAFVSETSGTALYDAAHNEYLQYLCLYGIFGLAAYLLFLGSLLVRASKQAARDDGALVLLAGVAGYAIQAFFGVSVVLVAPVFFLACGLLESRLHAQNERGPAKLPR